MKRANRSPASGFTMVEILIVLALVSVVMGSVVAVLRSSMRACQVGSTAGHLEALVNRALDQIADRLQASSHATVTPSLSSPFSSPSIDFQRSIGYAGGAVTWSPTERFAFQFRPGELDDGIDNDGDGIVDDGQVVWTRDVGLPTQTQTVLADGVPKFLQGETLNNKDDNGNGLIDERGLCFAVDNSSVVVRLTLSARSAAGVIVTKTMEKRVFFRNR
jgi:prepilin-type N-terminal cleavage/methylation domain-containing protein